MPDQVSVELSGEALPLFSGDPASDSAIGLPMPSMTGADFEGKPVSIVPGGRPMVVLFLAHWCPHCQREVPKVQTYQDQVGFPAGVDFYSVATSNSSSQPNWPPSAWLAREGWTFPVLVDDQESRAFQAAGRGAFPYFVFVDSAGNVALRLSGEQDPLMLASIMEQLASS
jgi:thiol-disulfide isomerase/thioredoxin